MIRNISCMIVAAILVIVALVVSQHAAAAPAVVAYDVTSTVDDVDDNPGNGLCHTNPLGPAAGACTLRAAIMEANRTSASSATITLPAGVYTLTISATPADGEADGDLNLTAPNVGDPLISIAGAGADSTFVDANQIDRVIKVAKYRRASISGLTLRHGLPHSSYGGGIYNAGTLTLTQVTLTENQALAGAGIENSQGTLVLIRSTLSGNQAVFAGAGIESSGTLSVTQSTLSGNNAGSDGGGIYVAINQNATLLQSTLSANTAGNDGGGIFTNGNVIVVNSTLSQNTANNDGGGIYNYNQVNIYNSSVVFNLADADRDPTYGGSGGGIWNDASGTFNLLNTLVAGNTKTDPQAGFDDCAGTLNAYGWNLFWTVNSCTINTQNSTWGYLSSLAVIGPLQNNGGPTLTHALLPSINPLGNPIDSGGLPADCLNYDGLPLATDQRGARRAVDGNNDSIPLCDIGAFEYQPPLFLPLIRR